MYPTDEAESNKGLLSLIGLGGSSAEKVVVNWEVREKMRDNMFPNFHVCPRLNRAVRDAKLSNEFTTHDQKERQPLRERLASLLGLKGKERKSFKLGHTMDCIVTHLCHAQPLPAPIAPLLPEIQQSLLNHYNIVASKIKRYASGPLLEELLSSLQGLQQDPKPKLKFSLYSGHDTGPILPLLHAFGVPPTEWPAYASTISLELYQGEVGVYAVRVLYNGTPQKLPACGGKELPIP